MRAGVHIRNNIVHLLKAEPLEDYTPQQDFLRLYNCGDGTGIGFRFGVAMVGKWVFDWKDAIDRVWFMESFAESMLPDLGSINTESEAKQFDAHQHLAIDQAPEEYLDAAEILMSTGNTWPSMPVKHIINKMTQDQTYQCGVVDAVFELYQRRNS